MDRVRIAVVGTGEIAERHGRALGRDPRAQIAAAVDPDAAAREGFAQRHGGRACASLAGCLDEVDAVYVLTPPTVRRALAVEALGAGKHLFCEKPLGADEADARAIRDAAAEAARASVVSAMGLNMRFRAGFDRLRRLVASGAIGRPYHFWRLRFGEGPGASGKITQPNWRTDPAFVCGMTVESFSHDADLMRYVTGDEPTTVSAVAYGTVPALPAFDNNAHAVFTLRGGGSAVITASWSSRIGFNQCGVLGEEGTAYLSGSAPGNNGSWCSHALHRRAEGEPHETVEMIHDDLDDKSYDREAADFLDAITKGTSPRASLADGYETVRISEAVLRASAERTVVRLDGVPAGQGVDSGKG